MRRVEPAKTAAGIVPALATGSTGRNRRSWPSQSRRAAPRGSPCPPRAACPVALPLEAARTASARGIARAARRSSRRRVPARHREPVLLALVGRTRISTSIVGRAPWSYGEHLLGVLLSERGDVGRDDLEQLGDLRSRPRENARPALSLELVRQARDLDERGRTGRVHLIGLGRRECPPSREDIGVARGRAYRAKSSVEPGEWV